MSFSKWNGELELFSELKEVWVKIEGIPTKWCTWKVIAQVASAIGVLVNVDWHMIQELLQDCQGESVCERQTKNPKRQAV